MAVIYWPGNLGYTLRYRYWKKRLKFLGKNVRIDVGVHFQKAEYVSIDDNSWIDRNVLILAGPDNSKRERKNIHNPDFTLNKGEVYIGKFAHVAPNCILSGIGGIYISDNCGIASGARAYSFSHHYKSLNDTSNKNVAFSPMLDQVNQYMIEGPIYLGENVGVGLNAVILPGVSIGKDSFVAIGSVVYSSFPENSFVQGMPGKRVKSRFKDKGNKEV